MKKTLLAASLLLAVTTASADTWYSPVTISDQNVPADTEGVMFEYPLGYDNQDSFYAREAFGLAGITGEEAATFPHYLKDTTGSACNGVCVVVPAGRITELGEYGPFSKDRVFIDAYGVRRSLGEEFMDTLRKSCFSDSGESIVNNFDTEQAVKDKFGAAIAMDVVTASAPSEDLSNMLKQINADLVAWPKTVIDDYVMFVDRETRKPISNICADLI